MTKPNVNEHTSNTQVNYNVVVYNDCVTSKIKYFLSTVVLWFINKSNTKNPGSSENLYLSFDMKVVQCGSKQENHKKSLK